MAKKGRRGGRRPAGKAPGAKSAKRGIAADVAMGIAGQHHRAGRFSQAEHVYRQILKARPDHVAARNNLGVALKSQGRLDDAIACYRRTIEIDPDYTDAHCNLGNALYEQERLDEAAAGFRRAIEIDPQCAKAHDSLGGVLDKQGMPDEAIACFRRGLELHPDDADAHNNLGVKQMEQGRAEAAIAGYRRALEIDPDYADAHNNLGNALKSLGKLDEAMVRYRRAIELRPDYGDAHFNYALALLTAGDLARGWTEHEWRWKRTSVPTHERDFPQPLWDGSRLDGRTILLHAEQGLGDTIHFIRYAAMVADCGCHVAVECHPLVIRLLAGVSGIDELIRMGRELPPFDVHAPLLSLPMIIGTRLETIPGDVGYIRADGRLVEAWRDRLSGFAGRKIGLCWQGNPDFPGDRWRSIPLKYFAVLLDDPSSTFINLHKGAGEGQIGECGLTDRIVNYSPEVTSLVDTAAIMENLDLVITSDTSVAHLAGAIGRPVWTLLQFMPDWRWLLEREDSPWYPTMRLFRQGTRGDWEGVLARVKRALDAYPAP